MWRYQGEDEGLKTSAQLFVTVCLLGRWVFSAASVLHQFSGAASATMGHVTQVKYTHTVMMPRTASEVDSGLEL